MSIVLQTGRHPVFAKHLEEVYRPDQAAGNDLDLRAVAKIHSFMNAVTQPAPLAGMLVAGPAFSLVRNPFMSFLLSKSPGIFTRGLGLRMASATVALPGEVAAFAGMERAVRHVMNPGSLDWRPEVLAQEAGALGLTLALFKMHGRVAQNLLPKHLQRWRGLAAAGGMYSGIVHSHFWEEKLGWRASAAWDVVLTQSLESFVQLKTMGHLSQKMMGRAYGAWVSSLEAKAEQKIQRSRHEEIFLDTHDVFAVPMGDPRAAFIPKKNPLHDFSNLKMEGHDGDGTPQRGLAQVIPFRRESSSSVPRRDTPLIPPPHPVAAQGLRYNEIMRMISLFQNILPGGNTPLRPELYIPEAGSAWERIGRLTVSYENIAPNHFNPEILFQHYLEFLNGSVKLSREDSISRHIPLDLLLQEVLPAYLLIRRDHLPLAYNELADPMPMNHEHRDIWRTTTYLAMRLMDNGEPSNQLLYETASHFKRMVPKGRLPALAESINELAYFRINRLRKLQEFRNFLLNTPNSKSETLLAIDAFLEHPQDLMAGLDRLANANIKPTEGQPRVATQILVILHAARQVGGAY